MIEIHHITYEHHNRKNLHGLLHVIVMTSVECVGYKNRDAVRNKNSHHQKIHTNDLTQKTFSTLFEPKQIGVIILVHALTETRDQRTMREFRYLCSSAKRRVKYFFF